jgi:predicted DNA-binding WGR domain protein
MKVFFYIRLNRRNKCGFSRKMWKIERRGRRVQVWWGRTELVGYKPAPLGDLATQHWIFRTEAKAIQEEQARIAAQLSQGYQRNPRSRRKKG